MTDTFLPLACLFAVTAFLLVRGLVKQAGVLQYPFLASAVTAGWFLPQAVGIAHDPQISGGGFAMTMIMASLCLLATLLGEHLTKPVVKTQPQQYDRRRLLIGAAVLSVIGLVSYAQILRTPAQVNDQGLTTGIVTILFFLTELQYFGFAIALHLLLKQFSWAALVIVVLDFNAFLGFILFGGRRGPAMDVLMIVITHPLFGRAIRR